ncbi:MAG: protein translocase subunit SecD [Chloroflexi bacterium]|nr:protein translocase subunit SecD [Chloroflexota bacterium]
MSKNSWWLLFIIALFLVGLYYILPPDGERWPGRKGFKQGLDLKGGAQFVYEADLSKKDPNLKDTEVMTKVKQKIENRVNALGVSEPLIQVAGSNRIIVQLAGIKDLDEADRLIGTTAELRFMVLAPESLDPALNLTWTDETGPHTQPFSQAGEDLLRSLADSGKIKWVPATAVGSSGRTEELTGKFLKPNSQVTLGQGTRPLPEVTFEFNSEGAILFEQITRGLYTGNEATNKPLGVFLDKEMITAPRVNAVIKDRGIISGGGISLESGKVLAAQLNSGSLDVPLTQIQRQDVDATSGADSLRRSLFAGAVGLAMVLVFMIVSYRFAGIFAGLALFMYGALLLSIFKLIPVTLSLAGIAGLIISIGMAVDANVLVFERLKEELRSGISYKAAVEKGFNRAWPSIRDSNISTLITCAILYWFGMNRAPMVQGFALTLAIGVLVSMFTALTATKTFIRVFIGSRISRPSQASRALPRS